MSYKKYFVSFVEEVIFNPEFIGYVGGRVEVYDESKSSYPIYEIRFLTPKWREFFTFRDKWDFKEVTAKELKEIEKTINEEFYEKV